MTTVARQPAAPSPASAGRVRRVLQSHLVISLVLLAALCVSGSWGQRQYGALGWKAAGVSYAVVWVSASLAVWLLAFPWAASRRVAVALSSVLLKTIIPIAFGVALLKLRPDLQQAGLGVQLVSAYLSMLAAATVLTIWILDPGFYSFKNGRRHRS